MKKGIFFMSPVNDEAVEKAVGMGMSAVLAAPQNLDPEYGARLQRKGLDIYIVKDVFQGEEWWERFPDCRPVGRDGRPMEIAAGWYHGVCPTHPGVREQLLQDFDALFDYEFLSGLSFNFLRFPGYWEAARGRDSLMEGCYCQRCLSKFGGDPARPEWESWKAKEIAEFTARITGLRDTKAKRIPQGLYMIPWSDEQHRNARPGALGQDLSLLLPMLDYLNPMCHFGLQDKDPGWVGETMRWTAERSGKPVIPVVQGMEVSDSDFSDALANAISPPSDGAIVFTWELLQGHKGKLTSLSALYNR